MEMRGLAFLCALAVWQMVSAEDVEYGDQPRFRFDEPKPFGVSGLIHHTNGDVEGASLTGTYNPPGTMHSFSGSMSWQKDGSYTGGVSGDVDMGKGKSFLFGLDKGHGGNTWGHVGMRYRFGRSVARALEAKRRQMEEIYPESPIVNL